MARETIEEGAGDEFGEVDLSDARLSKRLVGRARPLARAPQCRFAPSLKGSALKAAYRFFDHPKGDPQGI